MYGVERGKNSRGAYSEVYLSLFGQIPDFDKKLSTMRKYEISCTIILQSLSQLKAMYEKQWEVIIDNCDSFLFLGCQGKTTLEYVSQKLGKTTIRSKDHSRTHGSKGSSSTSGKHEGRELMTVAELQQMPDKNCILFIRGLNPFYCTKYNLEKHKNFKYTGDADDSFNYEYVGNVSKPKVVLDTPQAIEEATKCPDVNAERIMKEQRIAETIESGEVMKSKNGEVLNEFKPIEQTFEELQKSDKPISITIVETYDRDYEFRTDKPYMLDLNTVDLTSDEYDGDEPDVDNLPDGWDE